MAKSPENPAPVNDKQAAQQDVFLREVDDALRQDEMLGVFKRYGMQIGSVVVAGLLALAGYLWWDNNRKEEAAASSEQLTIALDKIEQGSIDAGNKELAGIADDGHGASATAARMMQAGIALQKGRNDEAAKAFAAVAADSDAPKPFRDLAMIRETAIRFDYMAPQQVVDRLKGLAVPGNPWFGSAGELVGLAYLKQGKNNLAGPLFASIARDKDTPESLRRRARQLAGMLGVDAIDDAEKLVAGEGDPAQTAPAAP